MKNKIVAALLAAVCAFATPSTAGLYAAQASEFTFSEVFARAVKARPMTAGSKTASETRWVSENGVVLTNSLVKVVDQDIISLIAVAPTASSSLSDTTEWFAKVQKWAKDNGQEDLAKISLNTLTNTVTTGSAISVTNSVTSMLKALKNDPAFTYYTVTNREGYGASSSSHITYS